MAGYKYLRPITWHQELFRGIPTFSDFIEVRTDLDGRGRLIVLEDDPSRWAYCLVRAASRLAYDLCGWLWGHEAKQSRFMQLGDCGRRAFFIPKDHGILRPMETLVDLLIDRPLVTGRAEDGRFPPGLSDDDLRDYPQRFLRQEKQLTS